MNNIDPNSNFVSDEFKIPATFEDLNDFEQFPEDSINELANEILYFNTSQEPGGKAKYYDMEFLKEEGINPFESKSFVPIKNKESENFDIIASEEILDLLKNYEGAEVYRKKNKGKPQFYNEDRTRKHKMTDEEYKRFYDATKVAFANLATQFQPLAQKNSKEQKSEEKSGEINRTPRELYPLRRRVRLLKKEIAKEKQEREEQSKVAQEEEETRLVKEAENKADRNAEEAKAEEKNRYRERIIKLQNKFMDNLNYIHVKERASIGSISNKVKKYKKV